ncbi:MAG: ABC transporter substrate-binding protein [Peptococcaceae bacterium BICA1-8]|nr:MAG: ABC transporter substrate-binding protein [Peptococcaceae bacterium BICA1-8]
MKKTIMVFIFFLFLIFSFLAGCQGNNELNPKNPVTLTLWHNYGGQMKNTMDEMVDQFNDTIGAEKGIILSVTSISGSATLHEKLTMAANGDPGAPQLPDITTAYPKTALILAGKGLLVDFEEQFTVKELSAYVPRFIEEGRLTEGKLYVFPTAKSTEVLFVNTTIFNRFAQDTGISFEALQTFEGIIKAASKYYEWTDNQTPDIKNDGKIFFMPDSLFNLAQVGYKQLGDDFLKESKPDFSSPSFSKVWNCFYEPAVRGQVAIFDGYASDLAKTGDIVCTTGSTAGVLFFPPTVTYADNTTEPVEYAILPYPTFLGGEKIAIQRGGGMCVTKSTKEKEYAAGIFLKWFTEPKQNLRFVALTGYLPVTEEAFGNVMTKEIENVSDKNIKKLLNTAIEMHGKYDFYIPPLFEDFDRLGKEYENNMKKMASESREEYLGLLNDFTEATAFQKVSQGALEEFINFTNP